jgi:hypothetical protein
MYVQTILFSGIIATVKSNRRAVAHIVWAGRRVICTSGLCVRCFIQGKDNFRRITALLQRTGWQMGKDRVERI